MNDNISFYNMLVHIIYQGNLIEEKAAVKNIWEKNGNTFVDLYFYRTKKSHIIDGHFIHDIFDLTTEKTYHSPQELLDDYINVQENDSSEEEQRADNYSLSDFKHLEDMRDEVVILTFIGKCADSFTNIKERTIREYLKKHQPSSKNLSYQYIETFLKGISPQEENFYEALENIISLTPERACDLARAAVSIGMSDGKLDYREKIYLAEILQKLREQGLEPDVGL